MFTELYWKSRPCPNFKSFVLIIYFSTIILFCLNVNCSIIFAKPVLSPNLQRDWPKTVEKSIICFSIFITFATSSIICINVNFSINFAKPVLSPTLQPDWPKTGETFCPAGTGWPSWQRCWTILRPAEEAEVGQDRKGLGRTDDIPEELCPRRWAL